VNAPEFWSADSVSILARDCVEPARIAVLLKSVREDDVPDFLWRHEPDRDALARSPGENRTRGETDLREVIDRIAGGWAYLGWKAGYFDRADDAAAFFDEVRWILLHRFAAPDLAYWRHAGLHWAYGIEAAASDCFLVDYRTGTIRRGDAAAVPPTGAVINGVTADATGEGGLWALWRNQARLAELGCPAGVDVSALATAPGESLSAQLAPGAAAARGKRRFTLQSRHRQADSFATRNVRAAMASMTDTVGQAIAMRHAGALADAAAPQGGEADRRFARGVAAQAALPADMIDCITTLAATGQADRLLEALADDSADRRQANAGITVLAMDDAALGEAMDAASLAGRLIEGIALSAWIAGAAGMHYASTVDRWHGCPAAGQIRSASGDGDFLFLDDTSASRAVLNVAAFVDDAGAFDTSGFGHAARLLMLALDISLAEAAHVTPRIARRVWDYRPAALSLTGLAPLLISLGVPFDSDAGRATAAGLCALMTGTAYAVSAELAAELGAFPGWAENADGMRAVIAEQARAEIGGACAIAGLVDAARRAWADALDTGSRSGYRNAQVSAICPATDESALMGLPGSGIAPADAPLRFERLEGGGYRRSADTAITLGLRALGYDSAEIGAVLRRLLGHGSLERAPGVNHQSLRRRGFSEAAIAAIETRLNDVTDIREAFGPWTLGEDFCIRNLGFSKSELDDPGIDMLAAMGFSDAAIEAANVYCCGAGTVEGAAGLAAEHLAVFDGARRRGAQGRRRVAPEAVIRMMGAAQPFLSGAVGQVVELPEEATVADFRALLLMGWRMGLKTLTLGRAPRERAAPELARPAVHPPIRAVPASAAPAASGPRANEQISETRAMSQALALAVAARETAGDSAPENVIATDPDVVTGNARASRRGSPDSPRSATSVPSSADVVVEQRQV